MCSCLHHTQAPGCSTHTSSHPLPPATLSVSSNRHSQGTYTVPGLAPGTQLSPELPESHHADRQQQSGLGGG